MVGRSTRIAVVHFLPQPWPSGWPFPQQWIASTRQKDDTKPF